MNALELNNNRKGMVNKMAIIEFTLSVEIPDEEAFDSNDELTSNILDSIANILSDLEDVISKSKYSLDDSKFEVLI